MPTSRAFLVETRTSRYRNTVSDNTLRLDTEDEWPADQLAALSTAAQQGLRWALPPLALWVRGTPRLDAMTDRA